MRIEITRSGGVGGLTRRWSVDVSTTEAEQRWLPLAEAEAAAPDPPDDQRDRFTYVITIGYTEVSLPESRLEEPWRELIDRARADPTAPHPAPSDDVHPARPEESGGSTPPS
ncbi:protealysin inhibitor emfourin [uncultured Arthrobacter sp.]|uniref:protealysin inhibitor emfourin n=1 Tax=uncultured Arthrobacter sp. TaxID=114050 RepID=UPI00261A7132|nr:protealysin inhibitor emfourin [uncultured Arthrobacter sp.]